MVGRNGLCGVYRFDVSGHVHFIKEEPYDENGNSHDNGNGNGNGNGKGKVNHFSHRQYQDTPQIRASHPVSHNGNDNISHYVLATDPSIFFDIPRKAASHANYLVSHSHPLIPGERIPEDDCFVRNDMSLIKALNFYRLKKLRFAPVQDIVTLGVTKRMIEKRGLNLDLESITRKYEQLVTRYLSNGNSPNYQR